MASPLLQSLQQYRDDRENPPPGTMTNAWGVQVSKSSFAEKPRPTTPGRASFATFLIICSTSFFLGILFSLFPYDYPILWAPPDATGNDGGAADAVNATILAATGSDPFTTLEGHLRLLHASPPVIPRILHIVVATGLLGFFIKLFRPTESNMLFDGASLALYMVGIAVYLSNTVKGLRAVSAGIYGPDLAGMHDIAASSERLAVVEDENGIPGLEREGLWVSSRATPIGREDSLRVLCASNTILALILVGVLVLQAGQWYAERKDSQEAQAYALAAKDKDKDKDKDKHRHHRGSTPSSPVVGSSNASPDDDASVGSRRSARGAAKKRA